MESFAAFQKQLCICLSSSWLHQFICGSLWFYLKLGQSSSDFFAILQLCRNTWEDLFCYWLDCLHCSTEWLQTSDFSYCPHPHALFIVIVQALFKMCLSNSSFYWAKCLLTQLLICNHFFITAYKTLLNATNSKQKSSTEIFLFCASSWINKRTHKYRWREGRGELTAISPPPSVGDERIYLFQGLWLCRW